MYDLSNKVALVTGGAAGIGAAIVREFLKEGVKVVFILDINEDAGRALEEELAEKYDENRIQFIKCDVVKEEQLSKSFQQITEDKLYIDIIVNSAAIANDMEYRKEVELNLTALIASSIKGLELMRKDKGGKGGTIINISSVSALSLLSPNAFVYGATKAGVLHFTSSVGKEGYYSTTGVRTICMCFGSTDTDMIQAVKSFDEDITNNIDKYVKYLPMQTAQEAAQGTVEAYKTGKSGSVWVVWKKIADITDKVDEAYDIMKGDWLNK